MLELRDVEVKVRRYETITLLGCAYGVSIVLRPGKKIILIQLVHVETRRGIRVLCFTLACTISFVLDSAYHLQRPARSYESLVRCLQLGKTKPFLLGMR